MGGTLVPHFKRLSDFILARRQFHFYLRALVPFPAPGPERSDPELRLRRHFRPSFSPVQIPFKPPGQTHIRPTLDPHQPRRD